jgi:hypothetical protein
VREIIKNFQLEKIITKLVKNDLLYQLVEMFTEVDLIPSTVTNHEIGYIFEELLRRFPGSYRTASCEKAPAPSVTISGWPKCSSRLTPGLHSAITFRTSQVVTHPR